MSDQAEAPPRATAQDHHRDRADKQRRLAENAWCVAARSAHLVLAELHEQAAKAQEDDWRPAHFQRERTAWAPLAPRRGDTLLEGY